MMLSWAVVMEWKFKHCSSHLPDWDQAAIDVSFTSPLPIHVFLSSFVPLHLLLVTCATEHNKAASQSETEIGRQGERDM